MFETVNGEFAGTATVSVSAGKAEPPTTAVDEVQITAVVPEQAQPVPLPEARVKPVGKVPFTLQL